MRGQGSYSPVSAVEVKNKLVCRYLLLGKKYKWLCRRFTTMARVHGRGQTRKEITLKSGTLSPWVKILMGGGG